MKKTQDIAQIFRQMRVPASSKLDERVHSEIDNSATPADTGASDAEFTLGQIIALIMKRQSFRYTIATTLVLASLLTLVLTHPAHSAWAMEQAAETVKKYRGLYVCGTLTEDGKSYPLESWFKAEASGNFAEAGLIQVGDAAEVWTMDKKTYIYKKDDKTVYVEPGITAVFDSWPGPEFLSHLSKVKDYTARECDDPATGRKRVIVTGSGEELTGPQSFLLEFDVRTKLPVSMKIWTNSRREGTPKYDIEKILYFEDLQDSTFKFQPPSGLPVTNAPLTVSDAGASIPALSDPKYGISADGMTREQACQKILQQYWDACNKYDFARFRQLVPRAVDDSDEDLREEFKRAAAVQGLQLVKVGGIERTGSSKLGPLALVPSWVRAENGTVSEIWAIVQFRETDHGTSCVIYGEHGYALNVKE